MGDSDHVTMMVAGAFLATPDGVILHGTRSGRFWTVYEEYRATLAFVDAGAGGLGWNVTIGDGERTDHLPPNRWGWNAREHSDDYLAVEFAQARLGDLITDGQVQQFADWFIRVARKRWPSLPMNFPEHYELPAGQRDGKSDCDPANPGQLASRCREAILALSAPERETPDDWDWPTWYEAAVNLRSIANELGQRAEAAEAKLRAIRDIAAA